MKGASIALVCVGGTLLACLAVAAQSPTLRITYLYDNTLYVPGTTADWGFACLIEGHGHTVLFDTGTNPDIFRHNLAALKVDPSRAQALVLSHQHADHTKGIDALPAMPGLPVYVGEHFVLGPQVEAALTRIGARRIMVSDATPVQVFPGFTVTHEMIADGGLHELALVVDTPDGSVVIVGCAHPGIVSMLKRIAETTKRPIHMVIGGFHLMKTPPDDVKRVIAEFKSLGVAWAGPTHCTGEAAIRLFQQEYGDHFVRGGVGTVVTVPR